MKMDLVLNNLQWLIWHKTKSNLKISKYLVFAQPLQHRIKDKPIQLRVTLDAYKKIITRSIDLGDDVRERVLITDKEDR